MNLYTEANTNYIKRRMEIIDSEDLIIFKCIQLDGLFTLYCKRLKAIREVGGA